MSSRSSLRTDFLFDLASFAGAALLLALWTALLSNAPAVPTILTSLVAVTIVVFVLRGKRLVPPG
jgi:uncharacterized membrane protein